MKSKKVRASGRRLDRKNRNLIWNRFDEVRIEARLLRNSVLDPDGSDCWIWLGKRTRTEITRRGAHYGRINVWSDGRHVTLAAHRVAYLVWRGPILADWQIDHRCRNPSCINPAHLEMVTSEQNLLRRHFVLRRLSETA
jgi:hypothetical protein